MSEDAALEAQIRADPGDAATHLVYADLLQARGDPHGELIVLQHEIEQNPTPELREREREWFEHHFFEVPEYYKLTWRMGFVRAATIHVKVGYLRHAVEFFQSPSFRFLKSLRLEGSARGAVAIVDDFPIDVDDLAIKTFEDVECAHVAAVVGRRPTLRRLSLFTRRDFDGKLSLVAPSLVELVLGAERYDATIALSAKAPALSSLVLHGSGIANATLAAILERRWPLERLGLFLDGMPKLHAKLMVSNAWPHLKAVGVDADLLYRDDGAFATMLEQIGTRTIITSPLWSSYTYTKLGQALAELGRVEDAMRCFEQGLSSNPNDYEMWGEHGALCARLGRSAESIASYERAVELDPDNREAHHGLAQQYRDTNELESALVHAKRGCKVDPNSGAMWHVRGQIERRLGHPAATRSLRKALSLYQKNDAVPYSIACVHALLGERAKCLDVLATALESDPAKKAVARTDADLAPLRDDPDFARLVA